MYSDGIVEAHDTNDEEFGMDRLQDVVRANRKRTAQEIGQAVLSTVGQWAPVPEDDRSVVIVKALADA
jgi:serine phosphatase RsbU (regulator of sigma subunit)